MQSQYFLSLDEVQKAINHTHISIDSLKYILQVENIQQRIATIHILFNILKTIPTQQVEALKLAELLWYLDIKNKEIAMFICDKYKAQHQLEKIYLIYQELLFIFFKQSDISTCIDLYRQFISNIGCEIKSSVHTAQNYIIAQLIEELIKPYKFPQRNISANNSRKIKIAYIIWGDFEDRTPLAPIHLNIAEHHDKDIFDVHIFSMYTPMQHLHRINELKNNIAKLGIPIHHNLIPLDLDSDGLKTWASMYCLARQIYNTEIDILIFQGQSPELQVLAQLQTAPIQIGFIHGYPEMYTSPYLDYNIVPNIDRVIIETKTNSYFIPDAKFDEYSNDQFSANLSPSEKSKLGINQNDIVILSMGADSKFNLPLSSEFINNICQLLIQYDNLVWVIVGVSNEKIILDQLSTEHLTVKSKIIIIQSCYNWQSFYQIADIYLDTFPMPGGIVVYRAFEHKLPVVLYKQNLDYGWHFENKDYYAFSEIMNAELCTEYSILSICERLKKIILEPSYKKYLADIGYSDVEKYSSKYFIQYVKNIEKAYQDILSEYHTNRLQKTNKYLHEFLPTDLENKLHSIKLEYYKEFLNSKSNHLSLIDIYTKMLSIDTRIPEAYEYLINYLLINNIIDDAYVFIKEFIIFTYNEIIIFKNLMRKLMEKNNTSRIKEFCYLFIQLNKHCEIEITQFFYSLSLT